MLELLVRIGNVSGTASEWWIIASPGAERLAELLLDTGKARPMSYSVRCWITLIHSPSLGVR